MRKRIIVCLFIYVNFLLLINAGDEKQNYFDEIKALEKEQYSVSKEMHELRVKLIKENRVISELHQQKMEIHRQIGIEMNKDPQMKALSNRALLLEFQIESLGKGEEKLKEELLAKQKDIYILMHKQKKTYLIVNKNIQELESEKKVLGDKISKEINRDFKMRSLVNKFEKLGREIQSMKEKQKALDKLKAEKYKQQEALDKLEIEKNKQK